MIAALSPLFFTALPTAACLKTHCRILQVGSLHRHGFDDFRVLWWSCIAGYFKWGNKGALSYTCATAAQGLWLHGLVGFPIGIKCHYLLKFMKILKTMIILMLSTLHDLST